MLALVGIQLLDRPPKRKKDDGDGKTYVCGDK
jgi:hypothetical protein